eukprot:CAMPEP_0113473224 /NCGR_PEP_ID=MMETSP0014_2-20120614/17932_1 /TAXON_ID=2857 /ORGANISM="Nitzschia sp." /LENGTH=190 /DNA_ID=CAMNT_0000365981 /DNA_START=44 /DNA_END=616 /DNA_ORIENTATION=+ /assembly_acc=CAM_ASM_000159
MTATSTSSKTIVGNRAGSIAADAAATTEKATATPEIKLPIPPFTRETATLKVRMAEDAWNSRSPNRVKMAYSVDTVWRNRSQFVKGREAVQTFLEQKWSKEDEYRLVKELFAFTDNNIAVRFCYEYIDEDTKLWYRAHGNENWEFDANGLMAKRHASINDVPIQDDERKFHWDRSLPRPADHPGLSELGL